MATRVVSLGKRVHETTAATVLFIFYVESWDIFSVIVRNYGFS